MKAPYPWDCYARWAASLVAPQRESKIARSGAKRTKDHSSICTLNGHITFYASLNPFLGPIKRQQARILTFEVQYAPPREEGLPPYYFPPYLGISHQTRLIVVLTLIQIL